MEDDPWRGSGTLLRNRVSAPFRFYGLVWISLGLGLWLVGEMGSLGLGLWLVCEMGVHWGSDYGLRVKLRFSLGAWILACG